MSPRRAWLVRASRPAVLAALALMSPAAALGQPESDPAGEAPTDSVAEAPTDGDVPPDGDSPSGGASEIVPPRLASDPLVEYPEGAAGDAVVVLTLVVNDDGTVRSSRVAEGAAPFAEAAIRAAETWRFEPATRGGKSVAATIRFEIRFTPPAAAEPEPEAKPARGAGDAPTPTPPKTPPTPDSREIVVHGERAAPAVSTLSRAEVRQLPGAFGDPFRAIEVLPGVTPIASGVPFFYVRGAPPGNVGYYLDGVRVPYLYHIGLGPSVVHPGMVDRVDLYAGGYPARFGRFAGGIVSGETTPPRAELHGEGNLRLFDVGAMAETGFADGRGTALVGGRYSYTAAVLSLLAEDITLDYRDFQARASYDLTPDDRVSVLSFGSYDLLGRTVDGVLDILFGSEFYRADLRYDHFFGKGSRVRTAVTLGYDQTRIAQTRNATDRILGARVEVTHPLSEELVVRGGVDGILDDYGIGETVYSDPDDPGARELRQIFPARTDTALGGWADVVYRVDPRVEITPGVRVDLFTSRGNAAVGVDPRIAARFFVTDAVRIIHAYGLAHQPPSFIFPIPGLQPSGLDEGLQKSLQTSAGVEADLPADFTGTASVFYNAFFDMTDAIGVSGGDTSGGFTERALGSSMGFELFLRRRLTARLGGFLSYTLSRSMRSVGRETFPSAFDRTHVLNAALAFDLGRKWRAGTRGVFYTGTPIASPSNGLVLPPRPEHPERNPPFYRLDLRLEKRWDLARSAWVAFVAEVLNATLSKETFRTAGGGSESIGPVTIPSIGVEGGF